MLIVRPLASLANLLLNVWLDEYEWLIVLHLGLGTLLWATTLATALQVSPAREPARGRAEAVAA